MKFGVRGVLAAVAAVFVVGQAAPAAAVEKIPPDPKVEQLVKDVLAALQTPDEAARIKAVLPLVHKSLLNKEGTDLSSNVKQFSFKKASVGANNYLPEITEVQKGGVVTVGFKETAESCRKDKYFIKAKDPDGKGFRPAPIVVCLPQNGGEPRILDFGSLN
jgi:hypothetical protein